MNDEDFISKSSDAQALIDRGVKQGLEAAAKHFDSLADGRWDTGAIAVEIRSIVPPAQPKEKA